MSRVTLLLAIHNHQPDGNFDEVFAAGHDDCYARILGALEESPHVKVSLHHTGPLLEWIEAHRPAYLTRMRALVERGQVEVLGGAFYEPMLAVLPERDALGQIAEMRAFCHRHFGVRPDGMWLAERVWEPGLPTLLHAAGVRYTLLDDGHFRYAGETGALRGYYVTEKAGAPVAIFPIDQKLRYALPFQPAPEAIQTLLSLRDLHPGRDIVVTYGDDGEKFGMWPGTAKWVWGDEGQAGWLRDFFRLLGEHASDIQTGHFGDVLGATPPSGKVYLPSASYEEMGEWSLPASAQAAYHDVRHDLEEQKVLERARPFLRGGIWQGFFAKYPEADFLHKKMVHVSGLVAQAVALHPEHIDENALMTRELYRAQCNCPYWHGLFGGLYLNYLRDAVFRHLLVAEAFADAALGRPAPTWTTGAPEGGVAPTSFVEVTDVDADLQSEVVVKTRDLQLLVRPHDGGTLQELAWRGKTFALSNVLSRWPEGYHQRLREHANAESAADDGRPKSIHDQVRVKEPGLEKHLVYDTLPRRSLRDRFLPLGTTLAAFQRGEYIDESDFPSAGWQRVGAAADEVLALRRDGWVDWKRVRADKRYSLADGGRGLVVRWRFDMEGGECDVLFAPELCLTLLDGHSAERVYEVAGRTLGTDERLLASTGEWTNVPEVALANHANGFRVRARWSVGAAPATEGVTVWRFPIETVSMSEGGFERIYQGSVLAPVLPLRLGRGPVDVTLVLAGSDMDSGPPHA